MLNSLSWVSIAVLENRRYNSQEGYYYLVKLGEPISDGLESITDDVSMSYEGGIQRGEWAGNALDIVSPENFNADTG